MEREQLLKALRRPNYPVSPIGLLLDKSPASIYRMLERGELPFSKICGSVRVNRSALVDYIVAQGLEVDPTVLDRGA